MWTKLKNLRVNNLRMETIEDVRKIIKIIDYKNHFKEMVVT